MAGRSWSGQRAFAPAAWLLVIILLARPVGLSAQLLGIDLTFQSVAGGVVLTGAGTDDATLSFGLVSAFGAAPPGLTKVTTSTDFTLATNFGVRVKKALIVLSSNYTLRSRLVATDPLAWEVNGSPMTTVLTTVATAQSYATTHTHLLEFTIPFTHPAGAVNTELEVLAIAN